MSDQQEFTPRQLMNTLKAHFRARSAEPIPVTVPEVALPDGTPWVFYVFPATMREEDEIHQAQLQKGAIARVQKLVMVRAKKKDGTRWFADASWAELWHDVDSELFGTIASRITEATIDEPEPASDEGEDDDPN